jgi:hypothetical protein
MQKPTILRFPQKLTPKINRFFPELMMSPTPAQVPDQSAPVAAPVDENQLIAERREKLAAVRAQGVAFPNDFKPTHQAADLHQRHGQVPNEELEPQAVRVAVAGAGESTGDTAASDWLEYGARLGYRIDQRMSVDAFFSGVTGDRHMGRSLHAGLGLRVGF